MKFDRRVNIYVRKQRLLLVLNLTKQTIKENKEIKVKLEFTMPLKHTLEFGLEFSYTSKKPLSLEEYFWIPASLSSVKWLAKYEL